MKKIIYQEDIIGALTVMGFEKVDYLLMDSIKTQFFLQSLDKEYIVLKKEKSDFFKKYFTMIDGFWQLREEYSKDTIVEDHKCLEYLLRSRYSEAIDILTNVIDLHNAIFNKMFRMDTGEEIDYYLCPKELKILKDHESKESEPLSRKLKKEEKE